MGDASSASASYGVSEADRRFIRLHLDWLRRTGATPATLYGREGQLRRLAQRLPCDLLAATEDHLDQWQSALRVVPASTANYTMHTRGFYRWALDAGHISADPARRLPRPKLRPGTPRPIPEADLRRALDVAEEPLHTWLLLAACMGLRAHEIAQIRREDVTEVNGRLLISGIGKGNKPFRLEVPAGIEPDLRAHLSWRQGPLWRIPPNGRPAQAWHCTRFTTALMRSLDLPYTLHTLRHRYGTAFYALTKDPYLTADAMRHDSADTTKGYVRTSRAELTAAMDQLTDTLRPKSPSRRRKEHAA